MTPFDALPDWIAVVVSVLLVIGGCLVLIGSLGLLRLSNFYQRLHGPAMINTLGAGCILIASMVLFSALQSRPVIHEVLITVFVVITAPVTAILLMRAAIYRDRRSSRNNVPPVPGQAGGAALTGQREE
ncbi:MAG: cation:proton antiporter [Burkholderiales bacterium]|nr:cation:proton antiporter [Burkholderiales bacterium]